MDKNLGMKTLPALLTGLQWGRHTDKPSIQEIWMQCMPHQEGVTYGEPQPGDKVLAPEKVHYEIFIPDELALIDVLLNQAGVPDHMRGVVGVAQVIKERDALVARIKELRLNVMFSSAHGFRL